MPSRLTLIPERAYRWNFTLMGLDFSLFSFGLSFTSASVVLPLFIHHLTASNLALGAIPAAQAAGGQIVPLFTAGYTEGLRYKKPFILGWTVLERAPYLALAVLTPLLALSHPDALLWTLLAMLFLGNFAGGITFSAWLDMIARMLPADWRGRLFGLSSAFAGLLGIAGGAVAATLLARESWPTAFALCFACTFACLIVSFVCLALVREPEPEPDRRPEPHARSGGSARIEGEARVSGLGEQSALLGRLRVLLREDPNFVRYIWANGLLVASGVATAFYDIAAKRWFALSDAQAGLYAVVLLLATTLGNVLWGYLGDRHGHKRVVEAGALCTVLAALLAAVSRDPGWGPVAFGAVFEASGFGASALQLATLTFVTDFAPAARRPTYIGLASAARAPFAIAPPLLAGLLADRLGYGAVFLAAAGLATAGGLLILRGVRDPRMDAAAQSALSGGS